MLIKRLDGGDGADELFDVHTAGTAELPGPPLSRVWFRLHLTEGPPSGWSEAWAGVEDGRVVAGYGLSFPRFDNTHLAQLFPLVVHPGLRRRGLGSALLGHAVARARAAGRSLLLAEAPAGSTGAAFAAARGWSVGVVEARRVLDLNTAGWDKLARMVPETHGYVLEPWTGPASEDLLPDLAAVLDGMNDAPRSAGVEPMRQPLERVRIGEERMVRAGEGCYSVLARRVSDGAPAGFTRILLDADRSTTWGRQVDTTVLKEHRGHRLGLALKLANLFALRENEPHIERIITWNATSNRHMLAINEAMGFELLDEWHEMRLAL